MAWGRLDPDAPFHPKFIQAGPLAFALFCGFGLGSLLFQAALSLGFRDAFLIFGIVAAIGVGFGFRLFRTERPHHVGTTA